MSVILIEDDILNFTKGAIIHQTNCFTMGSGVAKALYTKYPIVKEKHMEYINKANHHFLPILGSVLKSLLIVN